MAEFSFAFIAYSDMAVVNGDPLSTNSSTGTNGAFSVNADAEPFTITVNDNDGDNVFHDAFIDPGGPQTLQTTIFVNNQEFQAGSVVELEFKMDTTTGERFSYVRIGGVNVGISGPVLPAPGTTYTLTNALDGEQEPYDNLACFTSGTMIACAGGERPIEDIRSGDRVLCLDNGMQIVRWAGSRTLSQAQLVVMDHLRPIRFRAGTIGNARDLIVSPQHRILVSGWQAQLQFGEDRALVPAKAFLDGDTVTQVAPDRDITYHHILFDTHQVVLSEGVPTESFHPGLVGLNSFDEDVRNEITAIFPEIAEDPRNYGEAAAMVLRVREARALVADLRH